MFFPVITITNTLEDSPVLIKRKHTCMEKSLSAFCADIYVMASWHGKKNRERVKTGTFCMNKTKEVDLACKKGVVLSVALSMKI